MYKLAGPLRRFVSTIIDTIILVAFVVPTLIPFINFDIIFSNNNNFELVDLINDVIGFIIVFLGVTVIGVILYYVILPQFTNGRTFGRLLTKTKVITEDNKRANIKTLIIREVLMNHFVVPLLSLLIIIVFIITFFILGKRSRTIGDVVSKTKLVKTDVKG